MRVSSSAWPTAFTSESLRGRFTGAPYVDFLSIQTVERYPARRVERHRVFCRDPHYTLVAWRCLEPLPFAYVVFRWQRCSCATTEKIPKIRWPDRAFLLNRTYP